MSATLLRLDQQIAEGAAKEKACPSNREQADTHYNTKLGA